MEAKKKGRKGTAWKNKRKGTAWKNSLTTWKNSLNRMQACRNMCPEAVELPSRAVDS